MANIVLSLDHPEARLLGVAGGKGASLAKMWSAGFPVPPGFIVTTRAFDDSGVVLPPALERDLGRIGLADLERLESLAAEARQVVLERAVPDTMTLAVTNAYTALGDGISVSVRSSATAEDLPVASFAGQYATFLNVIGAREVLARILHVWASIYSTSAIAYRLKLGLPANAVRMAVVVQKQLRPQASGVLFTRDPVTGDEEHFVVNAALGLGEGVVAGLVPTDSFTLSKAHGEVVAQDLATKEVMVDMADDGGSRQVPVQEEDRTKPALNRQHLGVLSELASRVSRVFGGHQDIEFAVQDGQLWLLQSRPITAITEPAPFPAIWQDPNDAEYTWTRLQFGATGPYLRLQEDTFWEFSKWQQVCFLATGSPRARNHILQFMNGYGYTRSPEVDDAEVTERQERHAARDRAYREQGVSLYEAEIRPQVEQRLAHLAKFRPRRASLAALYAHLQESLQGFGEVMGDLHWRMTGGMRLDWPSTYHEITGEAPVASGALLQAIPNKTTRLVRQLRNLAHLVKGDPLLAGVFEERVYHRLWEPSLRNAPEVRRFRQAFQRLLRAYGFRTGLGFGSPTTFTDPTWNMETQQPLELVRTYASQDVAALDQLEARARRSRRRETRRVRRMLAADQGRLKKFDEALFLAIDEVRRMENHNHIMEQGVAGAAREAIYWMGQGLVREGLLDSADELFHLSLTEIEELSRNGGPVQVKQLVRARREEFRVRTQLRAPATLGKPAPQGAQPLRRGSGYDAPPDAGIDGLILRGTGAAPGKATGRARVAPMTSTPPEVEEGNILVAQNVGPAWTPILPLLGGLVLDGGAVFQHSALVCREYGIPAVLMTRDATQVIVDGQTVTVDADEGIVHLVPR